MKRVSSDQFAVRIAACIIRIQRACVRCADSIVSQFSNRTLEAACIVSVALCVCWSGWLIVGGPTGSLNRLPIEHIRRPLAGPSMVPAPKADIALYERLHQARLRIDSIRSGRTGKADMQLQVAQRPGLYDSIRSAEIISLNPVKQ